MVAQGEAGRRAVATIADVVVILALLFFALPFAELAFIIYVGSNIGVFETLLLLVAVSVVGAWLAKRQGLGVWRALRARIEAGEVPGKELTDGAMVLFAGALLLTPGFLTDIVAVLLLLPFVRAGLRRLVRRRLAHRVEVQHFDGGQRWVDTRSRDVGRKEIRGEDSSP